MINKRCIVVRVTENQYERVRHDAASKGFRTVSQYIRSLTLEHDASFQQKFDQIYQAFFDKEKNSTKKERSLLEFI